MEIAMQMTGAISRVAADQETNRQTRENGRLANEVAKLAVELESTNRAALATNSMLHRLERHSVAVEQAHERELPHEQVAANKAQPGAAECAQPRPVHEWSVHQVSHWLEQLGLGEQYGVTFSEHEIDGMTLVELDSSAWTALGVWKLGHRSLLSRAITDAKAAAAESSGSSEAGSSVAGEDDSGAYHTHQFRDQMQQIAGEDDADVVPKMSSPQRADGEGPEGINDGIRESALQSSLAEMWADFALDLASERVSYRTGLASRVEEGELEQVLGQALMGTELESIRSMVTSRLRSLEASISVLASSILELSDRSDEAVVASIATSATMLINAGPPLAA